MIRNSCRLFCCAGAMGFVFAAVVAQADVPRQIHYQGKLRGAGGVPVDGAVSLRFRIYDHSTHTTPVLFDETHPAVSVDGGLFNVLVGSVQPGGVPDSALNAPAVYLGVSVNDSSELAPRPRVVTTPHAIKARSAEQLVRPDTFSTAVSVDLNGNVGIGTTTPGAKLDVQGAVKIADGTQGSGKVLTSDANGLASWQGVSAGATVGFPNAQVFNANSPGSWTVLDMSSVVGAAQAMVMLRIESAGFNLLFFRENGISQEVSPTSTEAGMLAKGVVNSNTVTYTMVKTDSAGRIQWRAQNGPNTKIFVIGYVK